MVSESDIHRDRLMAEALQMTCGNVEEAKRWLNTPLAILGGETPIDHAETAEGAQEVSTLISRTMYGIFS